MNFTIFYHRKHGNKKQNKQKKNRTASIRAFA